MRIKNRKNRYIDHIFDIGFTKYPILHNNDKIDPHQILYFLLKMEKFIYHKETFI